MYLDFDYFDGKEYTSEEKHIIELLWHRLYDEYYILMDDPEQKSKVDKTFKEGNTIELIEQLKVNADFLESLNDSQGLVKSKQDQEIVDHHIQATYKRLEGLDKRIKLKYFEPINDNLITLGRYINALINQYNANKKVNEKVVETEIKNVYTQVANAESWLERNININDMVCSHWIAIQNQVRQKRKASQNRGK